MNHHFKPWLDLLNFQNAIQSVGAADRLTIVMLLVANIIPIVLTMVFGWNIRDVVFFYWCENIIVGLCSIVRIATAQGKGVPMATTFFLVPFFTFHYFFFCFIHLIFIGVLFASGGFFGMHGSPIPESLADLYALIPQWGLIGILALAVGHTISLIRNYFLNGLYLKSHAPIEMFKPYGRIVVLHICILFGGFAIFLLGSPIIAVLILMVGKTVLDTGAHGISLANLQTESN